MFIINVRDLSTILFHQSTISTAWLRCPLRGYVLTAQQSIV